MEQKALFVVSGGIKLPIGYRFLPTDEELVVHYLRPKELGLPLPAAVIPELDVFQTEPWNLPGGGLKEENRYFFVRLKGGDCDFLNESEKTRIASTTGYWEATSETRLVISSKGNQVVGMRRTLVFSPWNHSTWINTQWVMHEFHLLGPSLQMGLGDRWVIYQLHQRKREPRRVEFLISKDGPNLVELSWEPNNSNDDGPPQPSSSSSSEDY